MDIEQVRTFLAVAGNDSSLEAATRLHVTQPTLGARITVGARITLWEGSLPTCLAYPREVDTSVLPQLLDGLRASAAREQQRAEVLLRD